MSRRRSRLPCCVLLLAGAAGMASAATLQVADGQSPENPVVRYVDNLGDCDGLAPCYATIMEAIAAAGRSEAIEMFPGVYHEAVRITGKTDLVLRGRDAALMPAIGRSTGGTPLTMTIEGSSGIRLQGLILESNVEMYGSPGTVIEGNLIRSGTICGSSGVGW